MSEEKQKIEAKELKRPKKKTLKEIADDEAVRNFDDVLEEGEKINLVYKPCKAKIYFSNFVKVVFPFLLLLIISCLAFFTDTQSGETLTEDIVAVSVVGGLFVLAIVFIIIVSALFYKHTLYAVTNKRILVRTGIFGVDYKSLDLKNVSASDVYVSLLDKILCKKTGSLRFGSNSSPIATSGYSFAHIVNPYQVYKEIKQFIEKSQKEENK